MHKYDKSITQYIFTSEYLQGLNKSVKYVVEQKIQIVFIVIFPNTFLSNLAIEQKLLLQYF